MQGVIRDQPVPYTPSGVTTPLPNRNFSPINPRGPVIETANAPGSSNPAFYNPYGGGTGTGGSLGPTESPLNSVSKRGKFNIYGGNEDLLKTIATRGLGIDKVLGLLDQESNAQGTGQRLSQIYQNYANNSGNPLLGEAYSNAAPAGILSRTLAGEQNRSSLSELLNEYYKMGGQIWGSALANTGAATQLYNAGEHRKVDAGIGWTAGIPFVGGILHGGLEAGNT